MLVAKACRCLAALLVLALLVPIAEAAGLGLTLQRIDSSQFPKVRVYVSVADGQGLPIAGLDASAFELLEDDQPVTGFQVESIIDSQEPIAVALTMDVSGGMNDDGKLAAAKQAANAFVETLGPKDTVAVITFSSDVKVVQGFTGDKAALKAAIDGLSANGATVLYDGIAQSAQLLGAVPQQRKVVLLLTDGEDETSKQFDVDGSIDAAKRAGAPVFAIGLGQGVKRDVLDKIGSATAGQAVYVAGADQLKQAFLSFGDQLRRQYVLQYTSKLPADDQSHGATVRAKYRGQDAEVKGSFTAKRTPLGLDVKGLVNAGKVSGTQQVEVGVTGGAAQQVELLVDDQSRATSSAAPFVLEWDTTKESPGIHRVVVRAKDAAGAPTDREFVVEVASPAPAAAPTATPAPSPTAARPAPTSVVVPTPVPATEPPTNPLVYAVAGLVALALAGGAAAFVLIRRRQPAPVAPPPPAPKPVVDDRTEAIEPPAPVGDVGATVISGPSAPAEPRRPRARLRVIQQGTEQVVWLEQPETVIGREASNPVVIRDPMASRRHAKVTIEDGEFWVEDLKSVNGTRVNGEVITRRKLDADDEIRIASATLILSIEQG